MSVTVQRNALTEGVSLCILFPARHLLKRLPF